MGKGNWSVGVIVDERAGKEQQEAITGIASGAAGGPISALSGLVGKFLGVESSPSNSTAAACSGRSRLEGLVDMAATAAMGMNPNATEPLYLDNTGHPAADRFALARATKSHVRALGLDFGRSQRKKQRTIRALRLAQCIARRRSRPVVPPRSLPHRHLHPSYCSARRGRISSISTVRCRPRWRYDRMMAAMGMTSEPPGPPPTCSSPLPCGP